MIMYTIKKRARLILVFALMAPMIIVGQEAEKKPAPKNQKAAEAEKPDIKNNDVKLFIDKIEIEGRLEKPQVMLFLPGQTPEIDDIQIERSFMKNIFRPVEKRITVETKFRAEYSKNQKSVIEW